MSIKILRIATRRSPLALWQANYIAECISHYWPNISTQLVPMTTSGDQFLKDKLIEKGGKGLFVKELEEALLNNQADIAVHSMKDVPATCPPGLKLTTICKRDNPLDALITPHANSLSSLAQGSIIGTSSLRRSAQLLAIRPDLQIQVLRGNINTRLERLKSGDYDAIILAAAGLERLNMQTEITQIISDEIMLPACGQGALGIESRINEPDLEAVLAPLADPMTTVCVQVERRVNAQLGGSCQTPLAIFCTKKSHDELWLRAKVLSNDGTVVIFNTQSGPDSLAISLADTCAQALLAQGAAALLKSAHD